MSKSIAQNVIETHRDENVSVIFRITENGDGTFSHSFAPSRRYRTAADARLNAEWEMCKSPVTSVRCTCCGGSVSA
jgi:hypothetical protein